RRRRSRSASPCTSRRSPTTSRSLEWWTVDGGRWTVREWWTVDGGRWMEMKETVNDCSGLSGAGGLAKGDASGDARVSVYRALPERRGVRPDKSVATRFCLDPVEHRRRAGTPDDERVPASPLDRPWLRAGSSDAS